MTDEARALNAAIGRHVRQAIQDAGSNLRVAAGRAGLSYRSVLRYMSGERDMPVPVLLTLVAASDVDLVRLMTRLQAEVKPRPTDGPDRPAARQPAQDARAMDGRSSGATTAADRVDAQSHLNHRMLDLGVTRLAARSIGPVDADELLAIADIVQEIVQELRST